MTYEAHQRPEIPVTPIMTHNIHRVKHESLIATHIFPKVDDLPRHVHDMLTDASAQLLSQQQLAVASHCTTSCDTQVSSSDLRSGLVEQHPRLNSIKIPSTRHHGKFPSNRHKEEPRPYGQTDTYWASNPPVSAIGHASSASDPAGYSYSHAPRTRFGDQQSDPCRRIQLQINYLNSLAARVPRFGSFACELRNKEMLRTLLTSLAREALERYAKQHGYAIEGKAIDLKCFGSLRNGFALPGADLDLVMTTHGESFPKELEAQCPRILNKAFIDAGFGSRMIQRARIPMIKLCEKPSQEPLCQLRAENRRRDNQKSQEASEFRCNGRAPDSCSSSAPHAQKQSPKLEVPVLAGIQCDINFTGRLALYSTELLRCYAICDERVRLVGIFVKMWAKARKIDSPYHGTLCSYGFILMVIHYLINVADPPLVPNLQLLCPPSPRHIRTADSNAYDLRFFNNETELRGRACYNMTYGNRQSVGELLRGFFAYYGGRCKTTLSGGFNWVQDVISIRTQGGLLSKLEKGWNTARTDKNGHRLKFLIAIEDPFEHNNNVGATVTDKGLKAIRAEFSRAQTIICRVQEIPGVGWEWRTNSGHVGQDLLADAEDNANQQRSYRVSSFPESREDQVPGAPGVDLSKESLACDGLIHPAASDISQKQQTQRDNFRRQATLAADTMRRMLRLPEGQESDASYGVTLDSRQFYRPNAVPGRYSAVHVHMKQCETDTKNVEFFATLPFNGKSFC